MSSKVEALTLNRRAMERLIGSPPVRVLARKLVPWMIETTNNSFVEFSGQENIPLLADFVDNGYKVIVVSNHQSQADVGPIVAVANMVRSTFPERISEFDFLVAETMGGGQQGKTVQIIYNEGVNPWLAKQKIHSVEIVSDNDVKDREMQKKVGGALQVTRSLRKKKSGILMCPEGTMEGGRINPATGEINGMIEMNTSSTKFFHYILEKKIKAVILPIGTNGLFHIFDPKTKKFTSLGLEMFTGYAISKFGGISLNELIGRVKIGKPFALDELEESRNPAKGIMEKIAELLPPRARGIYK